MLTCRVCLQAFKKLRVNTGRAAVCGRCVAVLNTRPAVAEGAQRRLVEMLRHGIVRRATEELDASEGWRRARARRELDGLDEVVSQATAGWVNRLLADPKNTGRDFKLLRAHRRHLLHFDRPQGWGYPTGWKDVAARVRAMDDYRCTGCGRDDRILDVHHIVYVYHFGTHRQENLATLCRPCHEAEHERTLDFGEGVNSDMSPTGSAAFFGWVEPTANVGSADDSEESVVAAERIPTGSFAPDKVILTMDQRAMKPMHADDTAEAQPELRRALQPADERERRTQDESAWCILACSHCQRSQRLLVVGDEANIACVFCGRNFHPGRLSRLRRAGW